MKKISIWAHVHLMQTRLVMVVLFLLLILVGIFLGDVLFSTGISLTTIFLYISFVLFFIGLFIYPSKQKKQQYVNFYKRHKMADLLLVTSTFFFIVYGGNNLNQVNENNSQALYAASYSLTANNSLILPAKSIDKPVKNYFSKKEVRKILKEKVRELRKQYKNSTKGEKIALIALSVLVAIGLISLIAVLACNLSCSGSDALAIIVAIGGIGLVSFLLVRVIQRITRGSRKKEKADQERT